MRMAPAVKTQSIPSFSDSSNTDPLAWDIKRLPATKALIAAWPCPFACVSAFASLCSSLFIPKSWTNLANDCPCNGLVSPSATNSVPRRWSSFQSPPGAVTSKASLRNEERTWRWRVLQLEVPVPCAIEIAAGYRHRSLFRWRWRRPSHWSLRRSSLPWIFLRSTPRSSQPTPTSQCYRLQKLATMTADQLPLRQKHQKSLKAPLARACAGRDVWENL